MVTLFYAAVPGTGQTAKPQWITTQGFAHIKGKQVESARQAALKNALQKAVDQVVTNKISTEALYVQLKLAGTILGAIPHARVVESHILHQGRALDGTGCGVASLTCFQVKLKTAIAETFTGADPEFQLKAVLNKSRFNHSDAMQIRLTATQDCYAYVFTIMENDQILRLIPNQHKQNNRLHANQPFVFPNNSDIKKGIRLLAHGLADKDVTREALLCLAIKKPLYNKALHSIQEGIFYIYEKKENFMRELIQQMVHIPLTQRTEMFIPYQIARPAPDSATTPENKAF